MNQNSGLVHSLRQQIVDRLRDDVLSGRLPIGERLSEAKLVERFGVSRTPIREALAQLSHEGLLESKPNHGVRVAPDAPDAIRELIVPTRRTLESFALRSIYDDLNEKDFAEWEEILEKLKLACEQRDFDSTAEWDIAFHRSIIRRAGEPDLEVIWSAILARVRTHFWQAHRNYENIMDVYYEHRDLVEIFKKGDKEAAIAAHADAIA